MIGKTDKKNLVKNILSLGSLQFFNYFLPLLTVPYLVRILGPEKFGLLAFATATVAYFAIITEYGFNLSATRQISLNRKNKTKINKIFSSVIAIKIILLLFSLTIFSVIIFSFDFFYKERYLYFITFLMIFGNVLFPIWFFQGIEKMEYITYLNAFFRLIATICIFVFVNQEKDYILVPLFNSFGTLMSGIAAIILVRNYFNVRIVRQDIMTLKYYFKDGWDLFLSNLSISLYTTSNIFFLGIFTNDLTVGFFAAAEKIIQAIKGLFTPITQALFPFVSKSLSEFPDKGLIFIKKLKWVLGSLMFLVSLILFLYSDFLIHLIIGDQFQKSILLLKILAFTPFLVSMSSIFGVLIMINLGYKKVFSRIIILSGITGIILSVILVPLYKDIATAFIILFVEFTVSISMYIYIKFFRKHNV